MLKWISGAISAGLGIGLGIGIVVIAFFLLKRDPDSGFKIGGQFFSLEIPPNPNSPMAKCRREEDDKRTELADDRADLARVAGEVERLRV